MILPLMEKFGFVLFISIEMIGFFQTILFTTDDAVLEKISTHDEMYVDQETTQDEEENMRTGTTNRPPSGINDVSLLRKLSFKNLL